MSSIFSKIINGEIPSYKVMETELIYAFLDIRPIALGHTLIVPKLEVDYFLECPEPFYSAVFSAAKPIGRAVQRATGCRRIGTAIIGLEVPHFHYHLVPMEKIGDLNFSHAREARADQLSTVHEKILNALLKNSN